MKSRWVVLSALIVMVGLAWAGAATPETSTPASIASTANVTAQVTPPADPYAATAPISTIGPIERKPCSIYSQTCVVDGGHCGPSGAQCWCLFVPGEGWRCGGGGGGR